jgi:DNA polymerase elongation subunit (family B)
LQVMEKSVLLITDKPKITLEGVEAVREDVSKLRKSLI